MTYDLFIQVHVNYCNTDLHKILNVWNPTRHLVSRCSGRLLAVLRLVILRDPTTASLLTNTIK